MWRQRFGLVVMLLSFLPLVQSVVEEPYAPVGRLFALLVASEVIFWAGVGLIAVSAPTRPDPPIRDAVPDPPRDRPEPLSRSRDRGPQDVSASA